MNNLSPKELKALVSLLDDSDEEVLSMVEDRIRSMGEAIIPFLEDEWESTADPVIQSHIEDLIHSVQFSELKRRIKKWKYDGGIDLLEGMYLCARYHFPDLEQIGLEQQIRQLALDASKLHHAHQHPYDQVRALNRFFFSQNKFRSNRKNFHSPSNSFINVVLESRKGNPLSMSVIYMLVAQALGIPLYGVNFPNLFILTFTGGTRQFYINVYNSGLIFTKDDVDDYLKQAKLPHEEHYFQSCSNIDIVRRNIRNLISCYKQLEEPDKIAEMEELLLILEDQ